MFTDQKFVDFTFCFRCSRVVRDARRTCLAVSSRLWSHNHGEDPGTAPVFKRSQDLCQTTKNDSGSEIFDSGSENFGVFELRLVLRSADTRHQSSHSGLWCLCSGLGLVRATGDDERRTNESKWVRIRNLSHFRPVRYEDSIPQPSSTVMSQRML